MLSPNSELPGIAISEDEAIEIRNDTAMQSLLLFIPDEITEVPGSLNNPFGDIKYNELLKETNDLLVDEILGNSALAAGRPFIEVVQDVPQELYGEFLANLLSASQPDSMGQHLWQIGLVPDYGQDCISRLPSNVLAVREIASLLKPARNIESRLVAAKVVEGSFRRSLTDFLRKVDDLAQPSTWTEKIGQDYEGTLSFEKWELATSKAAVIESLVVQPFISSAGNFDRSSKLKQIPSVDNAGIDGLYCTVAENRPASVQIKWKCQPQNVEGLAKWLLEVVPPADMRDDESPVLASKLISGRNSVGKVTISLNMDVLERYRRFVVRISAQSIDGEQLLDMNGNIAQADSQEFDVRVDDEAALQERATTYRSIVEAQLQNVVEGASSYECGFASLDVDNQLISVSIAGRASAQIAASSLITECEKRLISDVKPSRIIGHIQNGSILKIEELAFEEISGLSKSFTDKRAILFGKLSSAGIRRSPELYPWDDETAQIATSYVETYFNILGRANRDTQIQMLAIDSLSLTVESGVGLSTAVAVLLPTHPLRLIWMQRFHGLVESWMDQALALPANRRKMNIDLSLLSAITPANVPFFLPHPNGELLTYHDELVFGAGLYISEAISNPDVVVEAVFGGLDVKRNRNEFAKTSLALKDKIRAFQATHESSNGLCIGALNPGDGQLLRGAIEGILVDGSQESLSESRVSLRLFSDSFPFATPVKGILEFQNDLRMYTSKLSWDSLSPQFSVQLSPVNDLHKELEGFHISVAQGLSYGRVQPSSLASNRSPSLGGLLTPLVHRKSDTTEAFSLELAPATKSAGTEATYLATIHDKYMSTLGKAIFTADLLPIVSVEYDESISSILNELHEESDWVVSIDRRAASAIYSTPDHSILKQPYLLDYSPDFVEGIGTQVAVTTVHQSEVRMLLASAMTDLGLATLGDDVRAVLENLSAVSGQLALRLVQDNTLAKEAVSFAALVMHLKNAELLRDAVLIPLDAHRNLFTSYGLEANESAKRCDLLVVRLTARSFNLEVIEVKYRKNAQASTALRDHIVDQIDFTINTLHRSMFDLDNPRIDAELQWARFASLLHFYAEKAASNGLVSVDKLDDIHRYIDRVAEHREIPQIKRSGYVISLEDIEGKTETHKGVPIKILGQADLLRLGLTTLSNDLLLDK